MSTFFCLEKGGNQFEQVVEKKEEYLNKKLKGRMEVEKQSNDERCKKVIWFTVAVWGLAPVR